jgi:hypothetical protein
MGGRILRALCCAVLAATGMLVTLSSSASGSDWPNLPWVDLLPPAPSSSSVQPKPVANCRKPGLRCVRTEIKRMKKLQARLGCDHRAVFATTYLKLTGQLQRSLRADPHLFRYPRYLYIEDALFANVYFRSVRARNLGRPVPEAWRIAFDTAASGDANGAQDMLLGINAHVQNDMPFVLAALGQRAPDGTSRKPDHDVMNRVLSAGYERVVAAVKRRYDPLLDATNSPATPLDDAAGLEMVKGWREDVWRNAERLLNASSDAERAQVASQIEQNAAVWAQSIAAPQEPGYRSQRDAYCASALGKR